METTNGNGLAVFTESQVLQICSTLLERATFASRAGITYNGDRNLYETFGYKRQLEYRDYRARYERGGIAARIINAFPAATWHGPPVVTEVDKPDETTKTAFEEQYEALVNRLNLYHVFERADRLATLGHYAVIVLGVKGQTDWSAPLKLGRSPEDLLYLSAYSEEHAKVVELVNTPDSPLFGQPALYDIDFNRGVSDTAADWLLPSLGGPLGGETRVHASRVIHIAEGGLEDNIIGTPRLRAIWNLLDDLDKMQGGEAELCWMDAGQRVVLKLDPEGHLSDADKEAFKDHVTAWIHKQLKVMYVQGAELDELGGHVPDMSQQIDKTIDQIAGTIGMPKRLLIGSERGELASGQDENNWGQTTIERQVHYAESIVRQFIDRSIRYRFMPMPRNGYLLTWPDPKPLTEQEKSLIALNWTKAHATYAAASSMPIELIMPPEIYLEDICGFTKEQIDRITDLVEEAKAEMAEEEEAAREAMLKMPGGTAEAPDDDFEDAAA